MLKNFALFYVLLDLALIAICAYFGAICVLNSQLGLACAFLIAFASFYGYAKRVKLKAQNAIINDDFDEIFDENLEQNFDENSSKILDNSAKNSSENFNENLDENSKNKSSKISQNSKVKIPFSAYEFISAFAPFRLVSYAVLVLCFFWLLKNNIFEPISFLAGVAMMPFGALLASVFKGLD